MADVVLFVHPHRHEARALGESSAGWLAVAGHRAAITTGDLPVNPGNGQRPDVVVSLGGDGTMLRAVDWALDAGSPVLGVNLGRLGYLAEIEPAGLEQALRMFLAGRLDVEERMTLDVTFHDGQGGSVETRRALNEAVVEKTVPGHTVRIGTTINGHPFITYAADGVLVATPTGSTAYNLSARGPVVSPHLHAMVMTPVSPHMLFDRALVLGPTESVELLVLGPRPAVLVVDGEVVHALGVGWTVRCRASEASVKVVVAGGRSVHTTLREKFFTSER